MRNYNIGMNTLRQKRKELGLTQVQMANLCGVSRRTYQTYETKQTVDGAFNELVSKLDEMGILDGSNVILSKKEIKQKAASVFAKYPEVDCAYLFGSYARGDADKDSDVDIMVVLNQVMGMKFYGIGADLIDAFGKGVDLITHRQMANNEYLLKDILIEGIKIYER